MSAVRESTLPGPAGSRNRVPGRRSRVVALTLVLALVLLLPMARFIGSYNYVLQLGTAALMWVAMTSSWNILGGYTGYISLGHNVFFGLGGYFSALVFIHLGISPFASALLAGVFTMLVGIPTGLISLRTRGPAFIISTIALLLLVTLWLDNFEFAGGTDGLNMALPPFPIEWVKVPFYYGMLIAAAGAVWLGWRVLHSKLGLALQAIAQDEVKAEVAGVDTRRLKVVAFALSAFFPGVVGALWGYSLTYVRPLIFFTIGLAAQMVLMVIVGGRGTVAGPVIGAITIVALNEASLTYFGGNELNIVFTGAILVVVLLFFPQGVVGSLRERGRLPAFLDWD